MKRMNPSFLRALASSLFLISSGCSTVSYLGQAALGQLELWNHARPISEVVKDETTPPRIRTLLNQIPNIKTFGEQYGLKPTSNYTEYVKLDRPYVVTVVSACEELRFEPKTWKFPIVGGFPYLGFFKPERAHQYAEELKREGKWDVDVRGAPAYSTLGWFRDAVLSSMIPEGEDATGEMAEVVLHESVHATFYVNNQSPFNEGLASFVSERLAPLYLKDKFGEKSTELKAYVDGLKYSKEYGRAFHEAYQELDLLYRSTKSDSEKRAKKAEILDGLKARFKFKKTINNATLVGFKTYQGAEAALERAFSKCGSDWRRFLASLSRIRESFRMPHQSELDSIFQDWSCD